MKIRKNENQKKLKINEEIENIKTMKKWKKNFKK